MYVRDEASREMLDKYACSLSGTLARSGTRLRVVGVASAPALCVCLDDCVFRCRVEVDAGAKEGWCFRDAFVVRSFL